MDEDKINYNLAFSLLHSENMRIINLICAISGIPDYGEDVVNEYNSIYYDIIGKYKDNPPPTITS